MGSRLWDNVPTIPTLRKGLVILLTTSLFILTIAGIWITFTPVQNLLPVPLPEFAAPIPTVVLRQGVYLGIISDTRYPQPIEEFRGIPYGLSTGGERRFAAPLPITNASSNTFDASEYGYSCPWGLSNQPGSKTMDEDCLNANFYRPRKRLMGKLLPVVISFYGGSFNFGAGSSRAINNMVGYAAEPFLGVSFNHRVGALGFLSGKLADKEGLLNSGLKDQLLFLEWVRDNIEAFGGNPKDITVFGNSAGAHGVSEVLSSLATRAFTLSFVS